ncbi:MAG: aminopeptidase P family protein [Planctomycetes bacterium]|nr:aminopeptidase P family protein [Planctomycetota bacterium]
MTTRGISRDEYRSRLERTRESMAAAGLDVLVAYANRTHPGHVRYLSGYEPRLGIHDSAVCLVTPRRCALLTNASFDRPETLTWLEEVVVTSDYAAAVTGLLPERVRSLGIAGFRALPAPVYLGLRERLPGATLGDASDLLLALRQVKSPAEVALLRESTRITDAGGRAFLEWARPGVTEREVLVQVEAALKRAGSDEVSFSTQVSSGPRTAQVVAFATDTVLAKGGPVQLDCGATYHGYRGDLSRLVFLGRASGKMAELMAVTAELYDRCLELLRPGVSCAEVARLAVRLAEKHGLGECLYRSPNHAPGFVGHGIGCSYTEPPEIHPDCETVLRENMVVVLEPILSDPAVGGVKIEDPVLITAAGPERLSALPVRVGAWPSV